jgi:hypothetical protein
MTAAPEKMTARVAARRDDASDATPDVVLRQLTWSIGALSPAWAPLDAGDGAGDVLRRAELALAAGRGGGS